MKLTKSIHTFTHTLTSRLKLALFKLKLAKTAPANDQIIVMFIIVAVAAGVAGLLYIYATGTLLPNFENKLNVLVDEWFNHS